MGSPRGGSRVAVAVAAASLIAVLAFALLPAAASGPGPRGGGLVQPPALSANVTYQDMGGSWNCGQGHQSFQFFGNVQGGVAPYTYNWTFGDGSPNSSNASPTHTYLRFGQFVVNVSIRDHAGAFLNASVIPYWGISDACTGSTALGPLGVFGVALYAALLLAIILGAILVIRIRRRRPPPELPP